MKKARFIVIDGIGGSGKTALAKALCARIGRRALYTHEPGGAPYAEKIRTVLLKGLGPVANPLADFFLFWAARAEHIRDRIAPALRARRVVVSDRFDSSTFAFQVCGEKHSELEALFWEAREAALGTIVPDAYILLDLPVEVAATRRAKRAKVKDRFDEREAAFQKRVRAGFKRFARARSSRTYVVDANRPREAVEKEVWNIVRSTLR